MLLFQIGEIPEKALEISPANSLAYGFLVVVLSAAVVYLWKALRDEQKFSRSQAKEVIELVTKVGEGFDQDREVKELFLREWPRIRDDFNRLREAIEKII